MSRNDSEQKHGLRNGIAIGLILGVSLTIIAAFSGDYFRYLVECINGDQCDYFVNSRRHYNDPTWLWLVSRLVSTEDTLAAWAAALFSMVATFLLWRTLAVTRKMAEDASDLGNKQMEAAKAALKKTEQQIEIQKEETRPYLVCILAETNLMRVYWKGGKPYAILRIFCIGRSPAIITHASFAMEYDTSDYVPEHSVSARADEGADTVVMMQKSDSPSRRLELGMTHLSPGEAIPVTLEDHTAILTYDEIEKGEDPGYMAHKRREREAFDASKQEDFRSLEYIWLVGRLGYRDMQGDEYLMEFSFKADIYKGSITETPSARNYDRRVVHRAVS